MRSLRTAAALCLASPLAACIVRPDGRLHVFNEPYRALVGAQADLTCSGDVWGPAIPVALQRAFAGASALVETMMGSQTVTLSFVPVTEDETKVVSGVLVTVMKSPVDTAAEQSDALRYTLSHDLLAPLRTLQEMARILEREHSQQLPAEASLFLSHFSQGTNKLADRLEALLRLVKLSAQPLNCRTVDVLHLVNDVIAEVRAIHGDKAAVIVGDLPDAYADADLLRQLFTELLSNAFRFSRNVRAPRIEIGREKSDTGHSHYFVMDNGAGFDMKYAGKLFGLFQRMHGEAQFEGTGAGLAIARRIVERHGGTIRAEAMKDQGARFIFTLPAASTGARSDA